jgi:flagellar motor switch protein FliN
MAEENLQNGTGSGRRKPSVDALVQALEGPLGEVPVTLTVEIGRINLKLGAVRRQLAEGGLIRLDRRAGEPLDIYVNGTLFARGEPMLIQDQVCIRISEIVGRRTATES